MNWLIRLGLGLVLSCTLLSAEARSGPQTLADSLQARRFLRWPRAVQLRLAQRPVSLPTAPLIEQLVRHPQVGRAVRAELLARLAGHYLHENQPSLAVVQMLQTRQMALEDNDSSRFATACEWLCYSYSLLNQPRNGLRYGRQALRMVPGKGHAYYYQLGGIYINLADCAEELPDYPLMTRYFRRALRLFIADRDSGNMAVVWGCLAGAAVLQGQYAQAAQLLDSADYIYPRPTVGMQLQLNHTRGDLYLHQQQYAATVRLMEPTRQLARRHRHRAGEIDALTLLVPALSHLGRYQQALAYQQRLAVLRDSVFEESSTRHAQELQIIYDTQHREQELARQRQHIAQLQRQDDARASQLRHYTLLFVTLLVGAGLMLVLIVVRQRARHMLATAAEALRVRNRIAADLHDEVGTLLTRVNLQAELLRQTQPVPAPALDRLLTNSRAAASTMRDIVWSIDAASDTVGDLLDRMRDHLDQTAAPAGLNTELTTRALHDHDSLRPELRQHLYLIFKEAVTNTVRHARGASRLTITLERQSGQLHLTIRDDGQPAATTTRSGMGLRNMHQRAAALQAELEAGPSPQGGFRVHLAVPE